MLNCNLYPIAFGVEDHTFIISVAGGSGLPHHLDSVIGHLLGETVHFFFGSDRKGKVRIPDMLGSFGADILGLSNALTSMDAAFALRTFHVEQFFSPDIDVRAVHYFQSSAVVERNESTGELFCRIMVNRVDFPAEILPVEFADIIDIFYPDGNMFDFHFFRILWLSTKAERICTGAF